MALPAPPLPEGDCTIGIRAHQLSLDPVEGAVPLPATVRVAEVTGSESYVHIDVGGLPWVVLAPGVQSPDAGWPGLHALRLGAQYSEADGVAEAWLRRHESAAALVRPDHYVYGVASTPEAIASLIDEAAAALGVVALTA